MSLLFRILRAAHARGTHHKLALDALHRMQHPDAAQWERLFLKHAELYMQGSKAPDTEFKDFKNHVLHPRDGYWGGAPEKVASWYGHLVDALEASNWTEAVWCAGVLSHYATDPVHPFHTAQSEAENNIHAAAEWSINRSYDALWSEAIARHADLDVAIPEGPHWIKDLVCAAADRSNADYERLIAHYDVTRGVVEPTEGLDDVARPLVGELLVHAATLHARLLDRAIADAGVAPPEVSLAVDTVLATLAMPLKSLLKKLEDNEDRRAVQAMYDELKATGRVEATLREDDKTVSQLYESEVLAPRAAAAAKVRAARLPEAPEGQAARSRAAARATVSLKKPAAPAQGGISIAAAEPLPLIATMTPKATAVPSVPRAAESAPARAAEPPNDAAQADRIEAIENERAADLSTPSAPATEMENETREPLARLQPRGDGQKPAAGTLPGRAARRQLAVADDLEAAPSIGPKTAERFAMAGIRTVGDFLAADPEATALKLGARHITPEVIVEWKDQTRLVMAIPGLRDGHAQLLTGAGFRTVEAIAEAAPDVLAARVLAFAATPDGHRILREGNPPDVERIKGWCDSAAAVLAA